MRPAARLPHDLDRGERQRVATARPLVAHPTDLICDEIASAPDVSVQAGVLELMHDLLEIPDLARLPITHNPAVASVSDEVVVIESWDARGGHASHGLDALNRRLHPQADLVCAEAAGLFNRDRCDHPSGGTRIPAYSPHPRRKRL